MNINACNASNMLFDAATARQRDPAAESTKREADGPIEKPGSPPSTSEGAPLRAYTSRDLQHLMIDWGMTDSPWDVNGSGMVDVEDMLQVMNGISGGEPIAPPDIPTPTPGTNNTLQHVMVDWGQTDSAYDLNADGIVNVQDMMFAINNWESGQGSGGQGGAAVPPAPPAPPSTATAAAPVTAPIASEPPLTVTPSIATDPEAPTAPVAASAEPATTAIEKPLPQGQIRKITRALIERLTAAGYVDQPPRNLREIIDGLNIGDPGRKSVLAHLARHYPKGLGVNMRV